jgi:hypothetical protein
MNWQRCSDEPTERTEETHLDHGTGEAYLAVFQFWLSFEER